MKTIRTVSLALLIVLSGMPLPVHAQNNPEAFSLPDGMAGQIYRANIESVLREKYRLKLETDAGASLFRWTFASGEMPPGLTLRPNGIVVGNPRVPRDTPYRFQLKVTNLGVVAMEPLQIGFAIVIAASHIRMARVSMPRLTPIEAKFARDTNTEASAAVGREANAFVNTPLGFSGRPGSANGAIEASSAGLSSSAATGAHVASTFTSSPRTNPDNSYNPELIEPVLRTLRPSAAHPNPAPFPTPKPSPVIDLLREQATGDKIRGPAEIELKNLNVLRYDIRVGKEVRFVAGPDLTLPFIPPIPAQPEKTTPGGAGVAPGPLAVVPAVCSTVQTCFRDLVDRLNDIERRKSTRVNRVIVDATRDVNGAKADLEAVVLASDAVLATGGAQSVIDSLTPLIGGAAGALGSIDVALSRSWPDADIEELLSKLNILETDLLSLPTVPISSGPSFETWYQVSTNKATYDSARARIVELQTQLSDIKSTSAPGIAFRDSQNKLRVWKPILTGVRARGAAGFSQTIKVGCGFAFDSTKETKVKVVKRDRLADPGTAATEEEVVTVVCSSPLSVSAGFGFSNIDEKEFVLVPSVKAVTNASGQTVQTVISRFGFRNKSSFRTLPVLLLNTRIWEPTDKVALHISTGAAVDIKTGEGGTDLEYIVGPSISLWRSMFITPGLHIGRVSRLAGGFKLDEEVPTGISEPPVEKSWKKAFVTTFTYKIR